MPRSPAPEGGFRFANPSGPGASFAGEWIAELPAVVSPALLALFPARSAHVLGAVPVREEGAGLVVVCADPLRPRLAEDLKFIVGRPVRLAAAEPAAVRRLVRAVYPDSGDSPSGETGAPSSSGAPASPAGGTNTGSAGRESDRRELVAQASAGPVVELVASVLNRAVAAGAADVHFEAGPDGLRVRCRIDGALREFDSAPRSLAPAVASRIKVLASLDVAERRRPQDGRLRWSAAGRPVDLRVSTLPTQDGESVVLRVLDPENARRGLDALALPAPVRSGLERALARRSGLVAVTGPTGSGKTTTLYACLQKLNTPAVKILTVEDPVEYEIDGLTQVAVQPGIGLTFATALRAFLRQDPEVILVGEVRDAETAEIAVQAALTGHLVLATLHTNDAAGAVTRLIDLGIAPYRVAEALSGVLAQRLLRQLCRECRVRTVPDASQLAEFSSDARNPGGISEPHWFAATGCAQCGGTGYRGRRAIFEWFGVDGDARATIAAVADAGAGVGAWRANCGDDRGKSLRDAAWDAAAGGWTSLAEALQHV